MADRPGSPRRVAAVVAALAAAALSGVGGGAATTGAFSSATGTPVNRFAAEQVFGPRHVGDLRTATCGDGGLVHTLSGSGVPAGDLVAVVVALRSGAGAVSATDSAGNAYLVDADAVQGDTRVVLLSSRLSAGLSVGDTITVTQPSAAASVTVLSQFTDVGDPHADGSVTAGGLDASPTASVTTAGTRAVLAGAVATAGTRTVTQPSEWTATTVAADCAGTTLTLAAAHRRTHPSGTWTYAPTLDSPDTWALAIAGHKR